MEAVVKVVSCDGAKSDLILNGANDAPIWLYWCPALGVSARQYRLFAEAVAAAGIGIARHEWRGTGSSDQRATRQKDWGYRELLADISAGIAALRSTRKIELLAIGGHSLGAQLAALAQAINPRMTEALVLIASGIPWWRSFPGWRQPLFLSGFGTARLLSAILGYFPGRRLKFAGNEANGVIRDWCRSGFTGCYRPDHIHIDLDARLSQLKTVAWAAHLAQDGLAPKRSLLELQKRMSDTHWHTESFSPGQFDSVQASHFSWMQDPAPIVRALAPWLKQSHTIAIQNLPQVKNEVGD